MTSILDNVRSWIAKRELPDEDVFLSLFLQSPRMFISDEGTLWDFKETWPHSYSDSYFAGIARAVCAFSNTYGGIIIFGVHDARRSGGHNKVRINSDKFKTAISQLTGHPIEFILRHYQSAEAGAIDVMMIPPRSVDTAPIRFLKRIESYRPKILWVRHGHEVVEARHRHYPALFCRSDNLM